MGGGVVTEIFRDPYAVGGGGGSSRNFPGSIIMWVAEVNGSGRPSIRFFFRYLQ